MSYYHKNKLLLYNNSCWGHEISEEAKKYKLLDYATLAAGVGDMILNNNIFRECFEDFELINGVDYDEEADEFIDIYQYYIIDEYGASILQELTDEIVYYNSKLDVYLWAVDHWGTSWSYVLTNVKIYNDEKIYKKVIKKEEKKKRYKK